MNTKVKEFLESIDSANTAKVVRHIIRNSELDFATLGKEDLAEYILSLRPSSQKAIVTACYIISLYGRWLKERDDPRADALLINVASLDKKALWRQAKIFAPKKFVSWEELQQVIHDIEVYEEFNALYYATLFQCIYEGIYSEDMSVIKNLRRMDINGCQILLKEDDGTERTIEVSQELAGKLTDLSWIDVWERRNRYGVCQVQMRGAFSDSVFRVEKRKSAVDGSEKFAFYSRLRKINSEYLGRDILPFQLYISGIMHRIRQRLELEGILLETAFAENSRDRKAHSIIKQELERSNYSSDVGNFRDIVKGHIDLF